MDLFLKAFPENVGKSAGEHSHYTWKFHSFPASPTSYEFDGFIKDEMVSYYAAIPFPYKVKDQSATAGMVCDVMTHPAHQGKGLFTQMGRYATSRMQELALDFTTGYPIRKEVIPGHIKVGWKAAFHLPLYIRPTGPNSFFKMVRLPAPPEIISSILRSLLGLPEKTLGILYAMLYKKPTLEMHELSSKNSHSQIWTRLEQFYRSRDQSLIHLNKTAAFLKWRFGAPNTKYLCLVATDQAGAWTGVLILRPAELKGIQVFAIMDFVGLDFQSQFWLLREAVRLSRTFAVDAIVAMCSPHSYQKRRLWMHWFLPTGEKFLLIVKNLSSRFSEEVLLNEKHWDLFWIDCDDL